MKFFFPDSQDFVDESFDFVSETRSESRVRQRDDRYPHEMFREAPYDGMLGVEGDSRWSRRRDWEIQRCAAKSGSCVSG